VLKSMETLCKIKLTTVSEGLAILSFERDIPKFFSVAGHQVVKSNESYWSKIANWAEWDLPEMGFWVVLTAELLSFKESHLEAIEMEFDPGTRMHNICLLSLTQTVSFISRMLTHFETFQKEFVLTKFGVAKAFHVNTRVMNRFWKAMHKPRSGVAKVLRTGDTRQIAQKTFCATLQSLDVMLRIQAFNFKDDPMVASELVKFLTVNSGFKIVEKLETEVMRLTSEVDHLKKMVNSNLKRRQEQLRNIPSM
jgi:hypothetical protein